MPLAQHAAAGPGQALATTRRPTLLVVGCGDVGLRVLRLLRGRMRVIALTSSTARLAELRLAGALPVLGNLDQPSTLRRLGQLLHLADRVLHLAPPPGVGQDDARTARLLALMARAGRRQRLVYGSTTGVYGDAGGAQFDETRPVAPASERARRRVAAEQRLRRHGRDVGGALSILRIPGIYGVDRPGGHPRARLAKGTPVLRAEDDVYTNHIQADDLARACVAALWRGRPQRVVHVSDDTELRMGDYFDLAADVSGLPRPPRVARADAAQLLSAVQLGFMAESRRLRNQRMKQELRVRLQYPSVREGLLAEPARPRNDAG